MFGHGTDSWAGMTEMCSLEKGEETRPAWRWAWLADSASVDSARRTSCDEHAPRLDTALAQLPTVLPTSSTYLLII